MGGGGEPACLNCVKGTEKNIFAYYEIWHRDLSSRWQNCWWICSFIHEMYPPPFFGRNGGNFLLRTRQILRCSRWRHFRSFHYCYMQDVLQPDKILFICFSFFQKSKYPTNVQAPQSGTLLQFLTFRWPRKPGFTNSSAISTYLAKERITWLLRRQKSRIPQLWVWIFSRIGPWIGVNLIKSTKQDVANVILSWRKQQNHLKRRHTSTRLHGFTSKNGQFSCSPL